MTFRITDTAGPSYDCATDQPGLIEVPVVMDNSQPVQGYVLAIQIGGVLLALSQPPLALAAALLMFVGLLYRAATGAHQPLEIA